MRVYKTKEALLRAINKKKEAYQKAHEEAVLKFSKLGHGTGMRRVHIPSYESKEDKIRYQLEEELFPQLENFDFSEQEKKIIMRYR